MNIDMNTILSEQFLIDPSVSKMKDENITFAEYLIERELSINVYDADSLMQFGQCRVPLFEMLRQGRPCIARAKSCDVCSFEASDTSITGAVNVGQLQIMLTNLGKTESVKDCNYDEDIPDLFDESGDRKQPS